MLLAAQVLQAVGAAGVVRGRWAGARAAVDDAKDGPSSAVAVDGEEEAAFASVVTAVAAAWAALQPDLCRIPDCDRKICALRDLWVGLGNAPKAPHTGAGAGGSTCVALLEKESSIARKTLETAVVLRYV